MPNTFENPFSKNDLQREATDPDSQRRIEQAQKLFIRMGLTIGADGLVELPISKDTLTTLSDWNRETSTREAMMPTVDTFFQKTLLIVSLLRQRDSKGEIQYLLGKGSGVEVALLGNIPDRKRRNRGFAYRSHSDFELYAMRKDNPGTPEYAEVFGGQEYFPSSYTKGLSGLPSDLLTKTAETAYLGGVEILIPQLEILFLDKWQARESTPRPDGYDDECLARAYELDLQLLHSYLERFVMTPARNKIVERGKRKAFDHIESVERKFQAYQRDGIGGNDAIGLINRDMAIFKHATSEYEMNGISSLLWTPLEDTGQFDASGNLTDEKLKLSVHQKADDLTLASLEKIQTIPDALELYFEKIRTTS